MLLVEAKQQGCVGYEKDGERVTCACKDVDVIDMNHKNPATKRRKCSDIQYWNKFPIEEFKRELALCEPVCKNCHAIVTYMQRKTRYIQPSRLARRKVIRKFKLDQKKCHNCSFKINEDNTCAFCLCYKDRRSDDITVSQLEIYKDFEDKWAGVKTRILMLCRICSQRYHQRT